MVAGQQVDRVRREQRVRPLPGINRESIEQCIEIIQLLMYPYIFVNLFSILHIFILVLFSSDKAKITFIVFALLSD